MPRRVLVLLGTFTILALCAAALVAGISVKADLGFFLPRGETAASRLVADQFRAGPASKLILLAISGGERHQRSRASDDLTRRLHDSGGFVFVSNGTPRFADADLDALVKYRYVLNPAITPSDFSVERLRDKLAHLLGTLRTSFGPAIKRLVPRDPALRTLDIARFWAERGVGRGAGATWETADRNSALIVALPEVGAFDFDRQRRTVKRIKESFAAVAGSAPLRLTLGGPSVIGLETRDGIRDEAQWLSIVSTVLVGAFLLFAFRTPSIVVVVFVPIAGGLIAGAAAVQLVFGQVHGVTLGFGSILIGVAVDYPIHLVMHRTARESASGAIKRIWPILRLSAMTTIVAFVPMFFSSFPGLGQLGVFAAAGLLAAVILTRWVLPATMPARGGADIRLPAWPAGAIPAARWAPAAACVLGLIALTYVIARPAPIWDNDVRNLSPVPQASLAFDRKVRNALGAPDVRRMIVVEGDTAERVLQHQEALLPRLGELVARGTITKFDMAARYIPSIRSQRQRAAALPDPATLSANLAAAVDGLPFRADLFAPFLRDVEQARTGGPVAFDAFAGSRFGWRVTPILYRRDSGWIGLITLSGVADEAPLSWLDDEVDGGAVRYIDLKRESDAIMTDYRREALLWLALGAVAALVMLAIGLRHLGQILRVALPVGVSVVLTVALALSLQGPLTVINLMALLLVAGLGLDYALFLNRKFESQDDFRRTGIAVLLGNITTLLVFMVLAFSRLPVLNSMGLTVAIGAAISILMAGVFRRPQTTI